MIKKLPARLVTAAVAVLAGALLVAVPASPAAAACSGTGCNGLDPNVHCTATNTFGEVYHPGGFNAFTVQVRYSSGCNAYWGRAMRDCFNNPSPPAYIRIVREQRFLGIWLPLGLQYSGQLPCGGNPAWTLMLGNTGTSRYKACVGLAPYTDDPPTSFPESWWSTCSLWVYN